MAEIPFWICFKISELQLCQSIFLFQYQDKSLLVFLAGNWKSTVLRPFDVMVEFSCNFFGPGGLLNLDFDTYKMSSILPHCSSYHQDSSSSTEIFWSRYLTWLAGQANGSLAPAKKCSVGLQVCNHIHYLIDIHWLVSSLSESTCTSPESRQQKAFRNDFSAETVIHLHTKSTTGRCTYITSQTHTFQSQLNTRVHQWGPFSLMKKLQRAHEFASDF